MSPLPTSDAVHAKLAWDSQIAIVVSTLADGRILEVNDSFVNLLGYARDEMIGQTSAGLGLWVDPEQRAQLTAALMAGQPLRDFEATVRTKSGAELQVLATVSQVEIDGRTCLLTQLFDVTAYRQGETQFRALVEQLPIITYTHALDDPLTITYISPQVETVLGYAPSEVLAGQPAFLTTRTHADDRTSLREAVERTRATGEPFRAEYRVQARDGRWVWLRDEAVLVRNTQGHPLLWQGIITDISERRWTEEARQAAEARYRALFTHSLDAVLLGTPDG